ncbi:nitrous oxide reductase accessory protein NosL [Pontibacter beigongshangensis]|uniref:nitrous oxide reductase accessory protein NosL n=1 Tax=Pontibacter beigongshangensis TaxID=2574733 RepID=UPI00164F3D1E|nr:nitrous oxide reductase accessory protein NosL [Pontibacter beigongshangensis]
MEKLALYGSSLFVLLCLLAGCQVEPKPIAYGEASCAHCSMTVSDNRYGAELVNDKGKPFFFDSAECLAAYVNEQPEQGQKAAFLMVTDYTKPNELINAADAYFLQSEALPSPMGMNLTALSNEATANEMQQEHGGRVLNWEQVLLAVKNNDKFK